MGTEGVLLEISDLSSGYGKMLVVQHGNLRVDEGEIVSLLGPNGSGKSTLLNTICGLANTFEGKIVFNGIDITNCRPNDAVRMGIGYSPQISNVFPSLTAEENLEVGAYIRKGYHKEDLESVLSLFPELEKRRKSLAITLSGGERQMLAIARSLISEPKLLLLDEPTAGLSPKASSTLLRKVTEIRKTGKTILLVEQNARRALEISNRGYVMVGGSVVFQGIARDALNDPELAQLYFGKT